MLFHFMSEIHLVIKQIGLHSTGFINCIIADNPKFMLARVHACIGYMHQHGIKHAWTRAHGEILIVEAKLQLKCM